MKIVIDGETYTAADVTPLGWVNEIAHAETEEGPAFILAGSRELAGRAARALWADRAKNDPDEFVEMVGKDNLVNWCLGQSAGPGSVKVTSLEKWLDLHLERPEEEWASYDGTELEVESVEDSCFDWTPTVAYRVC